jgi:4-hydroxy-tetrahydrodipicolinate reductase
MKIALIGYGKMGQAIEKIALEKGHEVVLKISIDNTHEFTPENLKKADVAIEFTGPETAFHHVKTCIEQGVPVVCGSTGWLQHLPEVLRLCTEKNGSFLYASNFSIGVNLFFALNSYLAEIMQAHPDYGVVLKEIHHTQKKDAPSGTAITLAEEILEKIPGLHQWVNDKTPQPGELLIESERKDPYPGTHSVKYQCAVDEIEIIHTAHNRTGFASGALLAAEFIQSKKGVFSMKDVLGF